MEWELWRREVRERNGCLPGSVNSAFLVSFTDHNFTVESLLADTKNAESADHATW